MNLSFEVTEEDFKAFQEHFRKTSPIVKRYWRNMTLGATGVMFVALFLLSVRNGLVTGILTGAIGAAIMLAWIIILRLLLPFISRFARKEVMREALGAASLEITPEGLRSKSRRGESVFYWDSVDNIATTPTHTFIYVGRMQGLVIPQRRILSGNYPAFMQAFADVYAHRRDHALESITPPLAPPIEVPIAIPAPQETTPLILGNRHDTER